MVSFKLCREVVLFRRLKMIGKLNFRGIDGVLCREVVPYSECQVSLHINHHTTRHCGE